MREPIVFFDVETGGLDPGRHPIIQLAAVVVEVPGWREVEVYSSPIAFDPALCERDALALNSYSRQPEAWADAPRWAQVGQVFVDLCRRHACVQKVSAATGRPYSVARLAAHNARFDCEFVAAKCKEMGWFLPAAIYEPLDTVALARWATFRLPPAERPKDHRLGTLAAWLGIEHPDAHDALGDVRATVEVARRLLERLDVEASIRELAGRG